MVEKHMTQGMDLGGNRKMDWFFDEYVYGTQLPVYHFEGQVDANSDAVKLHFKLVQSGVTDSFRMLVPIYLELADGRTIRLGEVAILGNSTAEQTVQMSKPPVAIRRVVIDDMHDVLAVEN